MSKKQSNCAFKFWIYILDPGEAPSQSSEVADSQHDLQDKDGKKKRQRRQRTHFTSQQLQVYLDLHISISIFIGRIPRIRFIKHFSK